MNFSATVSEETSSKTAAGQNKPRSSAQPRRPCYTHRSRMHKPGERSPFPNPHLSGTVSVGRPEGCWQEVPRSYLKLSVRHHGDSPFPPTHPSTKLNKNLSTSGVFPGKDALNAKSLWGPNIEGIPLQTSKVTFSARAGRPRDARWLTGRQAEEDTISYKGALVGQKNTLVATRPKLLLAQEEHPSL